MSLDGELARGVPPVGSPLIPWPESLCLPELANHTTVDSPGNGACYWAKAARKKDWRTGLALTRANDYRPPKQIVSTFYD